MGGCEQAADGAPLQVRATYSPDLTGGTKALPPSLYGLRTMTSLIDLPCVANKVCASRRELVLHL